MLFAWHYKCRWRLEKTVHKKNHLIARGWSKWWCNDSMQFQNVSVWCHNRMNFGRISSLLDQTRLFDWILNRNEANFLRWSNDLVFTVGSRESSKISGSICGGPTLDWSSGWLWVRISTSLERTCSSFQCNVCDDPIQASITAQTSSWLHEIRTFTITLLKNNESLMKKQMSFWEMLSRVVVRLQNCSNDIW